MHRDLKPDNLMLVPDVERPGWDRVKILDFGIAKLGEQAPAAPPAPLTESGLVMGTPEYMAPEQCLGAARVDGQADVYALGVILYEMLCGRRPFDAESRLVLMTKHLNEAPPPPSQRRPGLDPQVEGLVLAMLAKTPEQRPDMAAVAAELSTATPPAPPETPRQGSPAPPTPTLLPARGASSPGFIAGPPLVDPARFYGRAREVKRIFELWRQRPLQNAAIIGPRRSGKTSLLHYLRGVHGCDRLRPGQRGEYLPRGARPRFVFVDFQDPRLGTRDGLLRHLLLGLGLPPPAGTCDLDGFLWTLTERLHAPAVFLLDEVDLALSRYPELDDSSWEALRSIAGSQVGGNLGFVLASHERPYDLAQSTGRGSPFFNIFGYAATLGPLTEPEARELIAGAPAPFAERDAGWILAESGRWPMLLQILCRERLVALEEGEAGDGWRAEALQQLAPFRHLLAGA